MSRPSPRAASGAQAVRIVATSLARGVEALGGQRRGTRRATHRSPVGTALRAFAHSTLIATVLALAYALPAASQDAPTRIDITAKPIAAFSVREPDRVRFGALEFRGGIELTSSHRHFGGVSAIRVAADGAHFVALTDKGRWLTGRIVYDERARPSGLEDAVMAPMLGADGRTLAARGWFDTESIAEDGGTLYVGIERVNRIVRFDFGRDGVRARGTSITTPPGIAKLPYNKGLEAMVVVPGGLRLAGTLMALSERGLDARGNFSKAFLIGVAEPGRVRDQAQGRFRHQRLRAAAVRRPAAARAQVLLVERRRDAHPPRRARHHRARRAASTAASLISADMSYSDRQHGKD